MGGTVGDTKWKSLHAGITEYFKPRTLPIVFKYYDIAEKMLSNKSLALSNMTCTPCLAVAKAVYAGECVCITTDNFNSDYCRGVNNLREKDEKWYSGVPFYQRWNSTMEAARAHQKAIPAREKLYEGFAAAPLERGVIDDPDGCLMYVTPEQAFWILVSSQNEEYKVHEFTFIGESTCSDSLLATAIYGKTALGIGSNGERSIGALPHTELILTLTMEDLEKHCAARKRCAKAGNTYPIQRCRMPFAPIFPAPQIRILSGTDTNAVFINIEVRPASRPEFRHLKENNPTRERGGGVKFWRA